jgi:hypothetical protein
MKFNPFWAGFLKQVVMVAIMAVIVYLSDATNLQGVLSPTFAVLVASLFSGLESSIKAESGGTKALFGAITVAK